MNCGGLYLTFDWVYCRLAPGAEDLYIPQTVQTGSEDDKTCYLVGTAGAFDLEI